VEPDECREPLIDASRQAAESNRRRQPQSCMIFNLSRILARTLRRDGTSPHAKTALDVTLIEDRRVSLAWRSRSSDCRGVRRGRVGHAFLSEEPCRVGDVDDGRTRCSAWSFLSSSLRRSALAARL